MIKLRSLMPQREYAQMDDRKKCLQGSESRDIFKRAHKQQLNGRCYAADADLVLAKKTPPGIVAYFDFKLPGDNVTFTEVLVYNEWTKTHPVFIIESYDPERGPFNIYRYDGGDWHPDPPIVNKTLVKHQIGWKEFQQFEDDLRKQQSSRQSQLRTPPSVTVA